MQEANSTKKFLIKRIIAFVCVLSILVSLCVVPASAQFDGIHDTNSVAAWEAQINPGSELMDIVSGFLGENVDARGAFWFLFDAFTGPDVGEIPLPDLISRAEQLNRTVSVSLEESFFGQIFENIDGFTNTVFYTMLGLEPMNFEVQYDENREYYRIRDVGNDIWYVNSSGEHYYSYGDSNQATIGDHWIHITQATNELFSSHVDLKDASHLKKASDMMNLGGQVTSIGTLQGRGEIKYKAIRKGDYVWANSDGYPYVSPADDPYWIILDGDRGPDADVKDENGDDVEGLPDENTTGIDLSGMTINLPDGLFAFIDSLTYDEGTKTYFIDASTKTYDVTNNIYITNNYSFKWEYHINYTSVTYIGQTEEYDKYYEVYYELPDGRDSADLTKEELEQLNLSIDVIPYVRSADDTSLRSLYHFDGDTRDSSYWNYCTDFTWNSGASLTYMDAGVFNGALYLDEKEHDFILALPSGFGSGDFTLQWRYYQCYTAAPVTDSFVRFGDTTIMQMNGSAFLSSDGSMIAEIPIGTWNEVAIIRESGKVYFYLNGVMCSVVDLTTAFSNQIQFVFGSAQQTYKYFDELRVLNYALASGGENYTPTAVPHDSNLSLVLPTDKVAVADEYWEFDTTFEPAISANMSTGNPPIGSSYGLGSFITTTTVDVGMTSVGLTGQSGDTSFPISIHSSATGTISGSIISPYGLILPLNHHSYVYFNGNIVSDGNYDRGVPDGSYTFTMVDSSGNCYSHYIDSVATSSIRSNGVISASEFEWGKIEYRRGFISTYVNGYRTNDVTLHYIAVVPNDGQTIDFVYSELVPGDTPNTGHEFHSAVAIFDEDDLNTPTLAVRTDLDITNYQIGGVRPSIPTKGQVWALVENQRITSIQIYNGQAWEGVDGRIWTGSRWIPASSYNIITLQDMYDIVDGTPNYEYIYTESGFWAWWQKSWNAFTEKLFALLGSGGSGGGGGNQETNNYDFDSDVIIIAPGEESGKSFWQFVLLCVDGGKAVVKGVRYLFDGVVSNVPDSMDSITQSFDSGGSAVSITEGKDPDAADMPEVAVAVDESEVLDPWRYR